MSCKDYPHSDELNAKDVDLSYALSSLKEEIEAINYYHFRYVTCKDEGLKKLVRHNRDEEVEHACMLLEWLRRNMPAWNDALKTYLFSDEEITGIEEREK